jgi:hypothetical protein
MLTARIGIRGRWQRRWRDYASGGPQHKADHIMRHTGPAKGLAVNWVFLLRNECRDGTLMMNN